MKTWRLIGLMLLGVFAGLILAVRTGQGNGPPDLLLPAVFGAFVGLGTELLLRHVKLLRIRFSLRTLLIATTLVAVGLGIVVALS